MRAEIEITLDSLLGKVSRETLRTAEIEHRGKAKALCRRYTTHRDLPWFLDATREADTKIRATLSAFITTSSSDISDQRLVYRIECRDTAHAEMMAGMIELTLLELICNSWYRATYQPQKRFDIEILGELKSHSFLNKRVERKYSLY